MAAPRAGIPPTSASAAATQSSSAKKCTNCFVRRRQTGTRSARGSTLGPTWARASAACALLSPWIGAIAVTQPTLLPGLPRGKGRTTHRPSTTGNGVTPRGTGPPETCTTGRGIRSTVARISSQPEGMEMAGESREPGWYPDHNDPAFNRFWNGHAWTARRHPVNSTTAPRPVTQQASHSQPPARGELPRTGAGAGEEATAGLGVDRGLADAGQIRQWGGRRLRQPGPRIHLDSHPPPHSREQPRSITLTTCTSCCARGSTPESSPGHGCGTWATVGPGSTTPSTPNDTWARSERPWCTPRSGFPLLESLLKGLR